MLDDSKAKKIGRNAGEETLVPVKRESPLKWRSYTDSELIRFRDEITACLPPLSLAEMNMEEQLLLQYHALRSVQNEVFGDSEIPVNQQAQIANSVSGVLSKLAEKQQEIYTSERLKKIESVLIALMKEQPTELAEAFLTQYEALLETL